MKRNGEQFSNPGHRQYFLTDNLRWRLTANDKAAFGQKRKVNEKTAIDQPNIVFILADHWPSKE